MQSEAVQRLAFAPTAMTAGYGYLAAGGQNSSVSYPPIPLPSSSSPNIEANEFTWLHLHDMASLV